MNDILKGKTSTGFNYEVDKRRLENYELLEAFTEMETNAFAIVKVINLLLGTEQSIKLKDHVRKDGLVDNKKIMSEIQEIVENSKDIKN